VRELRAKTGALFPSVEVELAEHVLQTRIRDTSEIVSAHLDRVTS